MATPNAVQVLNDKKILAYPSSLGSSDKDAYGQDEEYVMIKINTDIKSQLLRTDASLGRTVVTNGRSGGGVRTEPATTTLNTSSDAKFRFGEDAVSKEKWLTQKGMQSLDRVIVLPMPNEHSVRTAVQYNPEYEPTQLTKLGDMANQSFGGLASDGATKLKNWGFSAVINTLKSGLTSQQALLAEERLSANPKKEVMFDSFGFRKFSFNYMFAPRNETESNTVKNIIETLRYYSLPEISKGKLFYLFPAEFEISFMLGQKDNPHIPRVTTSVLQSVNVNYTPNSVWSTLPNGAPLALSVNLEFLELELVDRSRVWNKDSTILGGH